MVEYCTNKQMKIQNISICFLFLFSFSGLLKWIGLPFDPTLIFGVLTLLLTVLYLPAFKVNSLGIFTIPFCLFLLFHFFYFLTAFYSPSKSYYLEKMVKVFFNLMAFIAPIVIIKTNINFLFLKKTALFFFIGALLLIVYNWFANGLEIFFVENIDADVKLPNYMSVSYLLGSFILFFHERKSLFYNMLKLVSFLFIILLASKGVFLFMILIFLLDFRRLKIFRKENLKYIISSSVLFVAYLVFSAQNIFQHLGDRIFIGSDFEQDQSSLVRLKLLNDSFNLIMDNFFWGIGIGGFGILAENADERLAPHNIIVEVFLETGLVGFLFLGFLVYYFYQAFKKTTIFEYEKSEYLSYLYPYLFIFLGDLVSGIMEDSRLNYFWLGLAVSYYVYRNRIRDKFYVNVLFKD
jgi:O-antigen ligase